MPNTTIFNRGSVVLVPFPFSDQSSSKVRPAVVLNPPFPSDDLLIVAVSSIGAVWRQLGLLTADDMSNLDESLRFWFGLTSAQIAG